MGLLSFLSNTTQIQVSGRNVKISGNTVEVDGKKYTRDQKAVIKIEGNINNLEVIGFGEVSVTGDVKGDVSSTAGTIRCGNVGGKASSMSGDIHCGHTKQASSMSGDVHIKG